MSDSLTAYIDGERVGVFTQDDGRIGLTFDDSWRASARRLELSLSLPKSRRRHSGAAPASYLWNLLPDSEAVLERWASRFGISARNPMALLAHVGMDTAGAVQLSASDGPFLTGESSWEVITEADIAAHIRELRVDPGAWLLDGYPSGYFSLAGAQSKFALARMPGGDWAVPIGRAASTHIFKPGSRGLDRSDLNEHISMAAAAGLGLNVAQSRLVRFGDESAIVVQRYDRQSGPDAAVLRVHQEDMAQAAGIHPAMKYQGDGGPGIIAITDLIRTGRGRESDDSVIEFFDGVLFNWAILGTDAHAKNYSLLHDRVRGPRLAPLYDIASALPYPEISARKAKFAMSFGGHYRQHEVEPQHISAEASASGLPAEQVMARARWVVAGVADSYSQAISDARLRGDDAEFAARLLDAVAARARALGRRL